MRFGDDRVTTLASRGTPGFKDGDQTTALFSSPAGIMWHSNGNLYVADTGNNAIRQIRSQTVTNADPGNPITISLYPAVTIQDRPGAVYRIDAADDLGAGNTPVGVAVATVPRQSERETGHDPEPVVKKRRLYRAVKQL